ncbi:MAG: hypothetical protein M0Q95_03595 [Porticoccaceae bacterium]|nr:hypothetical protein [Porticoccaceae bacterium]
MSSAKEEKLLIPGSAGMLELAFREGSREGIFASRGYCAVVCHPHPLHGGTMDNKVVTTLVRTYVELGVPVARFNFRGVGASEGCHDQGIGEVDDLRRVVEWLKLRIGSNRVLLAGFSFGAGVVSSACFALADVVHGVFVAPPVGRYNFAPDQPGGSELVARGGYPCPFCVAMGGRDELVDPAQVYAWARTLNPAPDIIAIPEASHFFHGQLVRLREELAAVLLRQLG